MAKRRLPPDVAAFVEKHRHRPSGPVRIIIPEKSRKQDTEAFPHDPAQTLLDSKSSLVSSTTVSLKQPGELERKIEQIKEEFKQADLTYRAAIDQQVVECFRVASFLKQNWRGGERILGGEWIRYWGEHGRNGDAALKFVFKKVHVDPKKASFYYRATRKLFEEGTSLKDVPKRITAAGGYQQLADNNAEAKKGKTTTPPVSGSGAVEGDHGNLEAENKPKNRRRVSQKRAAAPAINKASSDRDEADDVVGETRLVTITAPDDVPFFDLSLPCSVALDVNISKNDAGEWLMRISGLKQIS